MASFATNKGKAFFAAYVRGVALPTNLYLALLADSALADPDINVMGDVTEIPAGNGYTAGGLLLTPNATDFDSLIENDAADRAELQLKDCVFTAAGGPLPSAGYAYHCALTDDNATVALREIYFIGSLQVGRQVTAGESITLQNWQFNFA